MPEDMQEYKNMPMWLAVMKSSPTLCFASTVEVCFRSLAGNRFQKGHNDYSGTWAWRSCVVRHCPGKGGLHVQFPTPKSIKSPRMAALIQRLEKQHRCSQPCEKVCWHIAAMQMKIHLGLGTDVSSSAVQWTVLFLSWERSKK